MDSRIVATLQTILQKPGNLQDLGQGGERNSSDAVTTSYDGFQSPHPVD